MISNNRSRVWVKRLHDVLKAINRQPKQITYKKPFDAIRIKNVDTKHAKYKRPGPGCSKAD